MKYEADRQFQEIQNKLNHEWFVGPGESKTFGPDQRLVHSVCEKRNGQLVSLAKATAGWDDKRGVTEVQRRKEEAADYRYFPEPDLVPVKVDETLVNQVRATLGELPAQQRARLQTQYGLSAYDAGVLTSQGRLFVAYFEEAAKICGDAKEACNWTTNEVLQCLNERKLPITSCPIVPTVLGELIKEVKTIGLNKQRAREVFAAMLAGGQGAKEAIAQLGFQVVADENQLLAIVQKAIAANPKAVADFKKGKTKAADAIKGAVMRETKGLAKMETVQQLILAELQKA